MKNSLHNFSHDRGQSFEKSCKELISYIDNFISRPAFEKFIQHFEKNFQIPEETIRHEIKAYLEGNYQYQKAQFSSKLHLKNLLMSFFKHIAFLIYTLLHSRNNEEVEESNLIVNQIYDNREMKRFSNLIKLFGKSKIIFMGEYPKKDANIISRPMYKYYDRKEILKLIMCQCKLLLFSLWPLSKTLGINLFAILTRLDNIYLFNFSIFKNHRSKYLIQERHYQTSALANFVFHKFGGKYSSSIQKNILLLGPTSSFIDLDIFFTLGEDTGQRALELGSRIGQFVPVGSLFMEVYRGNGQEKEVVENFDIIFLGINVSTGKHYVDAYEAFCEDYYSCFKWLAQYSIRNPHLKIGIKHHPNNQIDNYEMEIIKGSKIERIPSTLNSYDLAFQSQCVLTFGSTMGYELLAHGVPVFFLDPHGRCHLLPNKQYNVLKDVRAQDYQDLEKKLNKVLKEKEFTFLEEHKTKLCLESHSVSHNIYNWFQNH